MKIQNNAEVKASSPIRTSLYEREGSMWGSLKRPSPRPTLFEDWYPHHCLFGQHQLSHEVEKFSGKFSSDFEPSEQQVQSRASSDYAESCTRSSAAQTTRPTHTSESIKSIGIVESERSAVILSEARPELLWLAYAYPLNLTVDLFEPLQGHTVTLFPRTDPNQDNYYAALEFADQVHRRYHLDFRVSSLLEDNATPAQKSAEIDLADFLFT